MAQSFVKHPASLDPSRVLIVIPARFGSTRFPGKALADLAGEPLIVRVVQNASRITGAGTVVVATDDMFGAFGCLQLCGTSGHVQLAFGDTFFAFKSQLEAFVTYLRTGVRPFPFSETVELIKLVIAGIRSRENGGVEVGVETS